MAQYTVFYINDMGVVDNYGDYLHGEEINILLSQGCAVQPLDSDWVILPNGHHVNDWEFHFSCQEDWNAYGLKQAA
jgi:hypothetical protein